jgi:hypothetical protein
MFEPTLKDFRDAYDATRYKLFPLAYLKWLVSSFRQVDNSWLEGRMDNLGNTRWAAGWLCVSDTQ